MDSFLTKQAKRGLGAYEHFSSHIIPMLILGLSGGIGTGKSTVKRLFEERGIPCHDADACVHHLFEVNQAVVAFIAQHWPLCVRFGVVNRQTLGVAVFSDLKSLDLLESFLHPLVLQDQKRFVTRHAARGTPLVVLDVPLLFETGTDKLCDQTLVTFVDAATQRARVLSRPFMTDEKLSLIQSRQWPQEKRMAQATWAMDTAQDLSVMAQRVDAIIASCGRVRGQSLQKWLELCDA